MTIPGEHDLPRFGGPGAANAVLVDGPMAGRVVHVSDPGRPFFAVDEDGHTHEYRPAVIPVGAEEPAPGIATYRYFAPVH